MRAMILAAGRGARMRPLTDDRPKPMLPVAGEPMIRRLVRQLARAGIDDLVINLAWQGEQIRSCLADGEALGVRIRYSPEATALETAGGIVAALPLLGPAPFLIVNGDLVTDFDFGLAREWARRLLDARPHDERPPGGPLLGIGVLVPNPAHHRTGDFSFRDGMIGNAEPHTGTWAGIAVIRAALLDGIVAGTPAPLAPWLREAAAHGRLAGHWHTGLWSDVGTPARLRAIDDRLAGRSGIDPDTDLAANPDHEAIATTATDTPAGNEVNAGNEAEPNRSRTPPR